MVTPGDGSAYQPTSAPAITVYSAHFIEVVEASPISSNPTGSGTIEISPQPFTVGATPYVVAFQPVTLRAAASTGFTFVEWTPLVRSLNLSYGTNPLVLYPGPQALILDPLFTQGRMTTITSNPPGLRINVNNRIQVTPKNFAPPFDPAWTPGSRQTIAAAPLQQGRGGNPPGWTTFTYQNWSDGGEASHSITLPDSNSTVTANFRTQHVVNAVSNATCAGRVEVTPDTTSFSGYDAGTNVTLRATPSDGWTFVGWSSDLTGRTSPAQLLVDDEKEVIGLFNLANDPLAVTGVTPSTVPAGSGDTTLTVNGTGFVEGATICFGATCVPLRVTSANQATATAPAALFANPGLFPVFVR